MIAFLTIFEIQIITNAESVLSFCMFNSIADRTSLCGCLKNINNQTTDCRSVLNN